jgi:hypothetical protein
MSVVPLNRRPVQRYRLQFMAEELDLPMAGAATVGRSEKCDVTIFDPLVSREHARIVIALDHAFIEDLGSHNGTLVNGQPVRGRCDIHPGDRIRLGRSECVFKEVPRSAHGEDATCSLVYCADCELVYPKEAGACPHCASTETVPQVTRSGVYDGPSRGRWALQMLLELTARLLDMGAAKRSRQYVEQAFQQVEEQMRNGMPVDHTAMGQLVETADRLSRSLDDATWLRRAQRLQDEADLATFACG